jgi:quinol monooxygenase YgiN
MPGKPGNIIRFTTTAEGADQFASILERALEHVNAESGTTTWFAGRSEEDPANFFLVDLFSDVDARNAHFGGPAAQLILGEGGPLLAGQPELSALELLSGKNV